MEKTKEILRVELEQELEREIKKATDELDKLDGEQIIYSSKNDLECDYMMFVTGNTEVYDFLDIVDPDGEVSMDSDEGIYTFSTENAWVKLCVSIEMQEEEDEDEDDEEEYEYDDEKEESNNKYLEKLIEKEREKEESSSWIVTIEYASYGYSIEHLLDNVLEVE